jgi:F-box-like
MPPLGFRGRHGRRLGADLLEAIFSQLSARELAATELTCRQWRVPSPPMLHARPLFNGEHMQGRHLTLCGHDGDQSMRLSCLGCGSSPKQLMSLRQAVDHSRPAAVAAPLQGRPAAAGTACHQLAAFLLASVSLHPRQRHLAGMLGSVTESFDRRMLYLAAFCMPLATASAVHPKCVQQQC